MKKNKKKYKDGCLVAAHLTISIFIGFLSATDSQPNTTPTGQENLRMHRSAKRGPPSTPVAWAKESRAPPAARPNAR